MEAWSNSPLVLSSCLGHLHAWTVAVLSPIALIAMLHNPLSGFRKGRDGISAFVQEEA
jgi:hypothetical protein